jgi:hypothetical protein
MPAPVRLLMQVWLGAQETPLRQSTASAPDEMMVGSALAPHSSTKANTNIMILFIVFCARERVRHTSAFRFASTCGRHCCSGVYRKRSDVRYVALLLRGGCDRITPHPPIRTEIRCPLYIKSTLIIVTHSTPSKGAFFPSNQCKIAVHSAPHQLSVGGGGCGDYNANFSIVGRVVLLQAEAVQAYKAKPVGSK